MQTPCLHTFNINEASVGDYNRSTLPYRKTFCVIFWCKSCVAIFVEIDKEIVVFSVLGDANLRRTLTVSHLSSCDTYPTAPRKTIYRGSKDKVSTLGLACFATANT